jgi:maleylacetate reductase
MISGQKIFYLVERVIYGRPAAEVIAEEAQRLEADHIFIVTTRSLGGNSGPAFEIAQGLKERHAGTFARMGSHTPREDVIEAAAQARAAKADLLVSVGGGSVTDGTKVMLRCLWHGFKTVAELVPNRQFGAHVVPGLDPTRYPPGMDDAIRMIAVPTTFSASEFNFGGSALNTQTKGKEAHAHPLMVPRTVVLDPAATLPTPPDLLLSTGFKVFLGTVSNFCNPTNDLASAMALRATIAHFPGALRGMKTTPDRLEPRVTAQICTWWSRESDFFGIFGSAGLAIAQVLGGLGVRHGDAACVTVPWVLRWNAKEGPGRQPDVAQLMGQPGAEVATLLTELAADLGLPVRMRDVGIKREDFALIAQRTMGNALIHGNPRPVRAPEDILEILELAW